MSEITLNTKIDGLVKQTTRSCRNKSGGSTSVTFTIDFTGCTIGDLLDWATSSRVISGQRVWEKMSDSEIRETLDGKTVSALTIGKAPVNVDRLADTFASQFGNMSPEKQQEYLQKLLAQAKEA